MAARVINGLFVNYKGGEGGNVSNDLKQEHIVKCNRDILNSLRGNKTVKSIQIGTAAAFGVNATVNNFEEAVAFMLRHHHTLMLVGKMMKMR